MLTKHPGMQVTWSADPTFQPFTVHFHFSSNATHWALYRIKVHIGNAVTLQALDTPHHMLHYSIVDHGQAVAALKGAAFDCSYLNLPLIVINNGNRCALPTIRNIEPVKRTRPPWKPCIADWCTQACRTLCCRTPCSACSGVLLAVNAFTSQHQLKHVC